MLAWCAGAVSLAMGLGRGEKSSPRWENGTEKDFSKELFLCMNGGMDMYIINKFILICTQKMTAELLLHRDTGIYYGTAFS